MLCGTSLNAVTVINWRTGAHAVEGSYASYRLIPGSKVACVEISSVSSAGEEPRTLQSKFGTNLVFKVRFSMSEAMLAGPLSTSVGCS